MKTELNTKNLVNTYAVYYSKFDVSAKEKKVRSSFGGNSESSKQLKYKN